MSNVWTRAWRNTPGYDCGLCGRATCSAFARAYLAGDLEIDACPVMQILDFENLRTTLVAMREQERVIRSRLAPKTDSRDIMFLQPCKDDVTRVAGEFRLYNGIPAGEELRFGGFDPIVLCDLLDAMKNTFTSIKCSRELGYARADKDEMNITILQDGRINLRQIKSKEEAIRLATEIERVVIGSLICDCCGCDLLSILTGDHRSGSHPVLNAGNRVKINRELIGPAFTHGLVERVLGDHASIVTAVVDECEDTLRKEIQEFVGEVRNEGESVKDSLAILVNLLVEVESDADVTVILRAIALVKEIENALLGIAELAYESFNKPEVYKAACSLLQNIRDRRDDITDALTIAPSIEANISRIRRATDLLEIWKRRDA